MHALLFYAQVAVKTASQAVFVEVMSDPADHHVATSRRALAKLTSLKWSTLDVTDPQVPGCIGDVVALKKGDVVAWPASALLLVDTMGFSATEY